MKRYIKAGSGISYRGYILQIGDYGYWIIENGKPIMEVATIDDAKEMIDEWLNDDEE